jgi:hypothetical protein
MKKHMKLILQQAGVQRIHDCVVIQSLVQCRFWVIVMQITGKKSLSLTV